MASANGGMTNGRHESLADILGRPQPVALTLNNEANDILTNAATALLRDLHRGQGFDRRRNVNDECGYPTSMSANDYHDLYDQEPIAARVVECFPQECWKVSPEVYEDEDADVSTPFEEAFKELCKYLGCDKGLTNGKEEYGWLDAPEANALWEACKRADVLAGIGQYGILLLGLDDGQDLRQPAKLRKDQQLLYVRAIPEVGARVTNLETDKKSPRYGKPTTYDVTLGDRWEGTGAALIGASGNVAVHHTRIIHIPSDPRSNETFGIPRTHPVRHRLLDLRKLYGGSAEMYWKGAFPGMALVSQKPELGIEFPPDLRDVIEQWGNGLQRNLAIHGFQPQMLSPTVVDPGPQIDKQIEAICIKIGIPKRILMGSERGELSSSQDSIGWNTQVKGRHNGWCTPRMVAPLIDRLIWLGCLPKPQESYRIFWPDVTVTTEQERINSSKVIVDTLAAYIGGNVQTLVPPLEFLTEFMGKTDEEAEALLEAAEEQQQEMAAQAEEQASLEAKAQMAAAQQENDEDEEPEEPEEEVGGKVAVKNWRWVSVNAFCPTGEGGGIDPSCGSGSAGSVLGATEALYKRAKDPKLTYGEVERHITSLKNLGSKEVKQLAKDFGLKALPSSKKGILDEIQRKMTDRMRSWDRTQRITDQNYRRAVGNKWVSVNAFCPTGEGGGIDPTCSPGSKAAGQGKAHDSPAIAAIEKKYKAVNANGIDTDSRYKNPDGSYSKERTALHDKISSKLREGVPESKDRTYTMLGGGPASGKSRFTESEYFEKKQRVHVDSDGIKNELPEYKAMIESKDSRAAQYAHEESSSLAKRVTKESLKGGQDVLLDGTGDNNYDSVVKKVNEAKAAGYKVNAEYVTCDTQTAVNRNIERAKKTGRLPPEEMLRSVHKKVSEIVPKAAKEGLFDSLRLWDTNRGPAKLVMEAKGGKLKVHDQGAWERFLAKAKE